MERTIASLVEIADGALETAEHRIKHFIVRIFDFPFVFDLFHFDRDGFTGEVFILSRLINIGFQDVEGLCHYGIFVGGNRGIRRRLDHKIFVPFGNDLVHIHIGYLDAESHVVVVDFLGRENFVVEVGEHGLNDLPGGFL